MKAPLSSSARTGLLIMLAGIRLSAAAEVFQPASVPDPSQAGPAGGGGGSWAPTLSPDGHYLLFASTANNLVLSTNHTPILTPFPPKVNVYLRDRWLNTTGLVSVNLTGVQGGNGDSMPVALSTNGQFTLFESKATDLVPGDTNSATDVFVRDLVAGTTRLVSVNSNGVAGNGASRNATMTPDGRYVAFVSDANDLVPGDTNGIADVFVRDLQSGTTVLASPGAHASWLPYGGLSISDDPQITPNGRYVAFYSTATNVAPGVNVTGDIYVRDLATATTYWASAGARTALQAAQGWSNAISYSPLISADGQFVAYEASQVPGSTLLTAALVLRYNLGSGTTDLVATNASVPEVLFDELQDLDMTPDGRLIAYVANTNGTSTTCIYVWDAQQGTASLASGNLSNGVPVISRCDSPVLDPQGRWVAFFSSAPDIVTNPLNGIYHLYLHNLQAGTNLLLDADPNGVGLPLNSPTVPCLSTDARYVAFECVDAGFLTNAPSHDSDIFVRDLQTGTLELISAHDPALPSLSPNGRSGFAAFSASTDARYIAFASDADNLVPNAANGWRAIFLRDMLSGTNLLVSVNTNGVGGDRASAEPAISADGRYVAFTSDADDLVLGDSNSALDIFVRDLQAGTTALASLDASGLHSGNGDSYAPVISSDGRCVLFRSKASNLTTNAGLSGENLFVRDLQAATNYALTVNPGTVPGAAMTPNGRFIAFTVTNATPYWGVWDVQAAQAIYTTNVSGLGGGVGISPDGNRIAYSTINGVFATDLALQTSFTLSTNLAAVAAGLRFSADSRWLVYSAQLNHTNQVCLYDFLGGTNLLVSRSYNSSGPGNGNSDSPDLSSDARFVAYRSWASNLVSGATNTLPNLFLYDRQNNTTLLLTASRYGPFAADSRSLCPKFSSDAQTLLFQSWASDLSTQDFNHSEDILAYSLYPSGSIPLFRVQIISGAPSSSTPMLTWPVVAGKTYAVQFKDSLGQPNWQPAGGSITVLGNQGYFVDPAPAAAQRFYRIVAY